MVISAPGSGRKLQREVALTNVFVGFQLFDLGCVDDLALVDNRRVARKAKAKMHVLLGDQHRGPGAAELPQQFADPLRDDRASLCRTSSRWARRGCSSPAA
jgi:hypothetical protein